MPTASDMRVDAAAKCGKLGQCLRNEGLTSEARIDRHHEDEVEFAHHVIKDLQRCCRIQHQSSLATELPDHGQCTIDMFGCLWMEGNDVGARLGEHPGERVDWLHHQMNVDRRLQMWTYRFADHRSDRKVRDVMIVHHVEMNHVGACGDHPVHVLAKPCEVGGEYRRGDPESAVVHDRALGQ